MTLDEAIEILAEDIKEDKYFLPIEFIEAVKLSIEALRRIRDFRPTKYPVPKMLLPGETKE